MPGAYSSSLAEQLAEDVLARLTRYVAIGTQSRRDREGSPSTPGQLELGRILKAELHGLGLEDAQLDENGYVTATLAASDGRPVLGTELSERSFGLLAHLDTTPDAPGAGVHPIVHRGYRGQVI